MSSMCMYQGLGQMLTMCLQHHQGCSETPKCAYVIYGQPLSTACMQGSSGQDPVDIDVAELNTVLDLYMRHQISVTSFVLHEKNIR